MNCLIPACVFPKRTVTLVAFGLAALFATATRADEANSPLVAQAASLAFVPEDASFYSVMLRNREQLDILLKSNAWAKFKSLPIVQAAWGKVEKQWNQDSMNTVNQMLQLPENQQLLDVLADMASHEIFSYGDEQFGVSLELFSDAISSMRVAQFSQAIQQMRGQGFDESPGLAQGRAVLDTLAENLDAIETPTLVAGFKLTDRKAAQSQLKRLEVLARIALGQSPEFKTRFERKKIGDGDYLTLLLDGGLVPWDQVPLDQLAAEPGQYDALVEKLQRLKIVISIGLYKNFLLVSISDSTEHLENLGAGELLLSNGELKKAEKFAGERLTSIGYLSGDFVSRLNGSPEDLERLPAFVEELLESGDIDEDLEASILKDVKALAEDLKPFVPQPGPMLSFSFLTGRGMESYAYNWTQNLDLIGDKPLDLLNHLGGSPLGAVVGRSRVSVEDYQLLGKWVEIGWGYVTKLVVPTMKDSDKEQFDKITHKFIPLVVRVNDITENKLLPSLADGQIGLVMDGRWKSRQWVKQWPATEQPLAIPEWAIVLGVTDAKLFKQALGDYLETLGDGLSRARELNPQSLPPDFKIPAPDETQSAGSESFAYHIPTELGIDPQVVPNMGLSEHTAVFSLSLDLTARLLKSTPLKGEGPLADTKQPLAQAGVLNWAGIVDLATPWLEIGAQVYGPQIASSIIAAAQSNSDDDDAPAAKPAGDATSTAAILAQLRDVLSIAKTLRTITLCGQTDEGAGAVVQHVELHFEDLP